MRIRTHTNPLTFRDRHPKLNLEDIFEHKNNPIDVEIGFGRGIFLRQWAHTFPERNTIGIEVRQAIVDEMRLRLESESLKNVHVINSSAQLVLEEGLEDHSIETVFIFHPDPWFKKKHHKRRVIQPKLLQTLKQKMKKNGKLYISTDVESLWAYMVEMIKTEGSFQEIENTEFWTTHYKTHWDSFRKEQNRPFCFGTFEPTP